MYSQIIRSNFERNVWKPVRRIDGSILYFRNTWLTENTNTCGWMVPRKSPTEETWWRISSPSRSYYNSFETNPQSLFSHRNTDTLSSKRVTTDGNEENGIFVFVSSFIWTFFSVVQYFLTPVHNFISCSADIFVFLLSTRAGGLGINLTAADTVM